MLTGTVEPLQSTHLGERFQGLDNRVFGLFIDVSLVQGVLNKGFHFRDVLKVGLFPAMWVWCNNGHLLIATHGIFTFCRQVLIWKIE